MRWWRRAPWTLGVLLNLYLWTLVILGGYDPGNDHAAQEPENYLYRLLFPARWALDFIEGHDTFIVAAGTIAIATFTFTLWRSTDKLWAAGEHQIDLAKRSAEAAEGAAEISLRALTTVQRAFVFIDSFETHLVNSSLTIIPKWRNSGSTPTRNMTNWVSLQLFDKEPPLDFTYPELDGSGHTELDTADKTQLLFVGPQSTLLSSQVRLSTADLDAVRTGQKRAFIWGWGRYRDVFGATHIVRYCNEIQMTDVPALPLPDGTPQASAAISFPLYGRYNCTDEECNLQGFPDASATNT